MKKKNRKNKAILIVALILCISIGYAVLTTTLNITGNSEIKNAKWDIHFANLVVDSSSVEATTPATIDTNKTTINYGVYLAKPGDSYSFTVDVVNEGTIDGMINVVSNIGLTEEQQKYVDYSIAYDDGTPLQLKDGLKAGATKSIKVSVKYKDDINPEDLPQEEKNIDLTLKVDYVQADDTVSEETGVFMKSYKSNSFDDYHAYSYRTKVTKIVTKNNIDIPEGVIAQWDVSAAGDGSVVAYIEDDGSGTGKYQVTIGGDKKKIMIEDASYLFGSFTALKEIDLNNFSTIKTINMSGMFNGCSSLTSLDVSNFDTSKVTNMWSMFSGCSTLTSLDVSHFNTSKVTNMQNMFNNCSDLTSLNVSNFDTSQVISMSGMFSGCGSLTSLGVSNFDTSQVIFMSSMFSGCSSLKNLDVSNFDTSNVTYITDMFRDCKNLTNLDLRGFNTSNAVEIDSMFNGCSSLKSLDLRSFNIGKLTSLSNMFYGCSSLTSLDLSSFDTSNITNMSAMFSGCSSLANLDLGHFDTSKVTAMQYMFNNCNKLTTTITISNSATSLYYNMFSGAATENGAQITVNYTSATSDLVDQMIGTKYSNSNVVKGSLVS